MILTPASGRFLALIVLAVPLLARAQAPITHQHATIHHESVAAATGSTTNLAGVADLPLWAWLDPQAPQPGSQPGTRGGTGLAEYTSPPIDSPFAFNEALLSWNIAVPAAAGVRIDMRVAAATGEWSPWLYMGRWGDPPNPPDAADAGDRAQSFPGGKVDVDYFVSPAPARWTRLQYRLQAVRTAPGSKIGLRRVAITFSDTTATAVPQTPDGPRGKTQAAAPPKPGRLGVPFRSQKTDDDRLSGRLCSPTSLSMVLAHRGVDLPVGTVAKTAYDQDFDIYGNWPRNIQAAYALGVPGYLTRFSDWQQVERLIAAGQPIIVSVFVEKGQLRNAPYEKTSGHLIVIEGFDEHGDVLVNDPSVATAAEGQLVYRREDLTNVWLRSVEGTAYVLLPREP